MKKHPPLEFEKPIAELEAMLEKMTSHSSQHKLDIEEDVQALKDKISATKKEIYGNLTPWNRVQIVRHPNRPYSQDYIKEFCSDIFELHGDRNFSDDEAIFTGLASIGTQKAVLIGHRKGRDTKQNLARNFGCAHPEGYRKALRAMKLASKFSLPIVCLIDTPGAYPGVTAEERHISEAIAVNLRDMFELKVPIIAVVIGEGGSGGALGIGVADRVLILENAYYSVISPEGCASILWKDRVHAPRAAEALKLSSHHLKELGIIDEIIPEPEGGAHHDWDTTSDNVKNAILTHLKELKKKSTKQLLEQRYQRFRNFGAFEG